MTGRQQEALLAAGIATAALAAGAVTGAYALAALVAALGYLGWNVWQLAQYAGQSRGATRGKKAPVGLWGDVWRNASGVRATEYKLRKKLDRFDARFRDAAAAFPDALVALSRSFNVRWCNNMAADVLFGAPASNVQRTPLADAIDAPGLIAYLQAGNFEQPFMMSPPTDRSRVLSVRALPFGRKKHQVMLIASDITRTYHLDAARRDFVANVSHELRTPLTVIAGYLEPLADSLREDADWAHSIELMQEQAERMQLIIDDLTLLSGLESEEKLRHDETISMRELLSQVIRESLALEFAEGHELNLEIDDDAAPQLVGDRTEIRSAASNLVVNALRHTPVGTRVTVGWHRAGDGADLTVTDNGPGIAAEHLPRLTERFYRVDPARARRSGGTGLGLAIAKHVLSRHDAQLTIDSRPGQGSTFRCEFPGARVADTRLRTAGENG